MAVEVEIPAGSSAAQIGRLLVEAEVISSAPEFERAVRLQQVSDRLQAGTYQLETGMSVDAAIAAWWRGPAAGWCASPSSKASPPPQMLDSLAEQAGFEVSALRGALLDGSVTSDLLPAAPETLADWEGLLFPDTYEIFENDPPARVLQLLATTAEQRVASIDWSYLTDRGLTPYQGVIIASLIEREAALDEERPVIASVVFNRLDLDMVLQIDATIVYALGRIALRRAEPRRPADRLALQHLPQQGAAAHPHLRDAAGLVAGGGGPGGDRLPVLRAQQCRRAPRLHRRLRRVPAAAGSSPGRRG